jgi:hypothetical protein
MIDTNSTIYSIPLAIVAANKGLAIDPVSGTPVAELVKITNDLLITDMGCVYSDTATPEEMLLGFANTLNHITVSNEETSHDANLDGFIHDISKAVGNHISYAKNIVKPVIVEYVEDVQKSVGQVLSPSSQFKISMIELPKPMQNAGFETSINKYAEKPFIAPTSELHLGEIAPQGILELMLTGSKEYDEGVKEWFVNKGDQFFMDIWNNLFRDFKESKPTTAFTITECLNSGKELVDYALAIHLLSRKLYDEVPEDTKMELPQYRDLVAQYREVSGSKLNNEYIKYASVLKNKTLVAFIDSDSKGLSVYGPVYREWLKAGGCNEALLGMLVGRETIFNQSLFDEAKEGFIKDWNTYSLFSKTAEKNNEFNRIKDVLTISFAKILETMSSTERETVASMPAFTQTVANIYKQELEKLKTADIADIFNVCMLLICRARFYYTDAEKILVGINSAVKADPNIDVREAALLSSIEYVVDYISDQMRLNA